LRSTKRSGLPGGSKHSHDPQNAQRALARDAGSEQAQILEYYNSEIGTPRENANRARLLGDDLKVDCAGTAHLETTVLGATVTT
jgi:hypothetical protein